VFGFYWLLIPVQGLPGKTRPRNDLLCVERDVKLYSLYRKLLLFVGGAENARLENAGLELSAPNCRGGKCRTGIIGTIIQGWKMRDWKIREQKTYGTPRVG